MILEPSKLTLEMVTIIILLYKKNSHLDRKKNVYRKNESDLIKYRSCKGYYHYFDLPPVDTLVSYSSKISFASIIYTQFFTLNKIN